LGRIITEKSRDKYNSNPILFVSKYGWVLGINLKAMGKSFRVYFYFLNYYHLFKIAIDRNS